MFSDIHGDEGTALTGRWRSSRGTPAASPSPVSHLSDAGEHVLNKVGLRGLGERKNPS